MNALVTAIIGLAFIIALDSMTQAIKANTEAVKMCHTRP